MTLWLTIALVIVGLVLFAGLVWRFGVDSRRNDFRRRDASGRWVDCPAPARHSSWREHALPAADGR